MIPFPRLCFLALGAAALQASATPLLSTDSVSQYSEQGLFNGDLRDNHSDLLQVPDATTALTSHFGGYANGYAAATFSTLKGRAATFEPAGAIGHVNVGIHASVQDDITITDSVLAPGTPVNVLFEMHVDPSNTMTPDPANFIPIFPYAGFDTGLNARVDLAIQDRPETGSFIWNAYQHDANLQTVTYHGHVGETIHFSYALVLGNYVIDDTGHNAGVVDFSGGVSLTIDPQAATTELQSASGFNYSAAAAVPEPSSWAMLAAGLLLVGWRRGLRTGDPQL